MTNRRLEFGLPPKADPNNAGHPPQAGKCLLSVLLAILPASAAYLHPVTTFDGSVVYLEAPTHFNSTEWHKLWIQDGRITTSALGRGPGDLGQGAMADVSADGAAVLTTFYGTRRCDFGGSTCFIAAPCRAGAILETAAGRRDLSGYRTLARLSRDGRSIWIEQEQACRGFEPAQPQYQGLHTAADLQLLVPRSGFALASLRSGRHNITGRNEALVFASNGQLHLLGAAGARVIRHIYGATEAVVDSQGQFVVYTEGDPGRVRWIDLAAGSDDDLTSSPVQGSAPMLSDDGEVLAFLSPDGRLTTYRRIGRSLETVPVDDEPLVEFVLAGDGRSAFATTNTGRLVRVDLVRRQVQTWLEPFPEIQATSAPLTTPGLCPLPCYGTPPGQYYLPPGARVVFGGRFPNLENWGVRVGRVTLPLRADENGWAWFQFPDAPTNRMQTTAYIENPAHPLRFEWSVSIYSGVTCYGSLHQNFDRLVTSADPARVGEVVHVFMTGFEGEETIPYGEPNPLDRLIRVPFPPELGGEGALEQWFFGLAPGLIGVQQLDIRVLRVIPAESSQSLFGLAYPGGNCQVPPTAP